MKKEHINITDFMSLLFAILVSRNILELDLSSFVSFIEECKNNNKYLNLININTKNISKCIEKLENVISFLNDEKNIKSYYSALDNMIYINDNINYQEVVKNNISYFKDVSSFINDFILYENYYNYYDNYEEEEEEFYRVLS